MNLKKTLSLSLFLHLCFFAAVLLLSTDLSGGSSKMLDEKVFLVKLAEDVNKTGDGNPKNETKKPMRGKNHLIKIKPVMKFDNESQDKIISAKTSMATENNNNSDVHGLNTQEKSSDNVLFANYKTGENDAFGIPSGQEINISSSESSSSTFDRGTSKERDAIPSEIMGAIRNSIEKVKTYPLLARKRGIEGTVYISFKISPQGEPQNIKIIKGSGFSILDAATMDIVKKAAPFPPIDSPVEVPVVFKLN